jgi:CDP-glycerol glycerophosphotransferase
VPLAEGPWDLYARTLPSGPAVRVKIDRALLAELPTVRRAGRRDVMVRDVEFDSLAIVVPPELPVSETKRAGQRRLQAEDYPGFLRLPRRDLVLFDAYALGAYGDDARAVHEELARRDTGLDVLWSVVDGQAVLPEGVRGVPRHGRDWYEATARARYVVAADYRGTAGLAKAGHQRVLQTWHGSPVAVVGLDDEHAGSRMGRGWEDRVRREAAQWDLLLADGPEAATRLERAFGGQVPVQPLGLPRHDLFAADEATRRAVASTVRERLGIAADAQVLLFAPTHRPDREHAPGQYQLDLQMELDEVRAELRPDQVLLVRPHPKVLDSVPAADGSRIVDASRWQDVRELLLAADVLVTDYSSLTVDFALTGRPMVFWLPDAEYYREHLRSLYLDPAELPGPAAGSVAELVELASTARTGVPATYGEAYARFRDRWAPAGDGKAAARAVDALLEG